VVHDRTVDLDEVEDELFSIDPEQFTSAKNARAEEARAAGDVETANRIRRLKRPTAAAWALNLLVRRHPSDVRRLVQLGKELRRAQGSFSGDRLRRIAPERRQIVTSLKSQALRLATEGGRELSGHAAAEVEQTLEAALADEAAADRLRAGRLESALSHVGFLEPGTPAPAPGRSGAQRSRPSPGKQDTYARKVKDAAEKVRLRRERTKTLERQLARARKELAEAEVGLAAAKRNVAGLERELRDAQRALAAAERSRDAAKRQ
jgi:hypothetical protein